MNNEIRVLDKIRNKAYQSTVLYTKESRQAWKDDTNRLHRVVFQADLIEENGVTGHPKAQTVFEMAWERGHSAGLIEVLQEFEELVQLIK